MGFNEDQLHKQYYGKVYTWAIPIQSEQVGDPTRCTGVRRREVDGVMCLNLSNGTPVPIDRITFHLKGDNGQIPEPERAGDVLTRDETFQTQPIRNQQQEHQPIQRQQIVKPVDVGISSLFGNFTTKKEKFAIEIDADLPDFDLVKLMYKNSAKKDEFISKFSEYIKQSITTDCITKSVSIKFEIEDDSE